VPELVTRLVDNYPGKIRGFTALFEEFEPEERYDTVVMGHVLEHLFHPVESLSRVAKWLKPGGRVVILVPNALSLHRAVGVQLGVLESPAAFSQGDIALGHRRVYTAATLAADIGQAGLQQVHATGLVLKPLSNAQMDRWSDDLRAAYFRLGEIQPDIACVLMSVAVLEEA